MRYFAAPSPSARSTSIAQLPFSSVRLVAGGKPREQDGHAVDHDREQVGVELRVAALELRRAGGARDPAPVRVVPVERGLDERRGGDPLGDRARLGVARRAANRDLRDHGHTLAVGDDLLRELAADLPQAERELLVGGGRPLDAARAVREQQHGVARRALAVDRDRVEAGVDRRPEERDRLAGLERVVGRHDREHRREVRMDHPGALRHAADGEAGAVDDGLLRARVRGHDRLGGGGAARAREPDRGGLDAGEHLRERQRRADHAGREDEHLFRRDTEELARLGRGGPGVGEPARAGRGVRDAGVDDDRLRLRLLEVLLAEHDGRALEAVHGEHARADRRLERADDREVAPVVLADPAVDAARRRTPWRR